MTTQSTNETAVKALNGLIKTTLDSANGYKDAAKAVSNPAYKTKFEERATQRLDLSQRLQDQVRSFGGDPETDQSALGKAHNKFTELKGAVLGSSDEGVVKEVERGEEVLVAKYNDVARGNDLPPDAKAVVVAGYEMVKSDHDDISRIKHSLD